MEKMDQGLVVVLFLVVSSTCTEIPSTLVLTTEGHSETLKNPYNISIRNILLFLRGRFVISAFLEISCSKPTEKMYQLPSNVNFFPYSKTTVTSGDSFTEEIPITDNVTCFLSNKSQNRISYVSRGKELPQQLERSGSTRLADMTSLVPVANMTSPVFRECYKFTPASCNNTKMNIEVKTPVVEILNKYIDKFLSSLDTDNTKDDITLYFINNVTSRWIINTHQNLISQINTVISDPVCDISKNCSWIKNMTEMEEYFWKKPRKCSRDLLCTVLNDLNVGDQILAFTNMQDIKTIMFSPIMGTGDNCDLTITYMLSNTHAAMVLRVTSESFTWIKRLPTTSLSLNTLSLPFGRIDNVLHVEVQLYVRETANGVLKNMSLVHCNAVQENVSTIVPSDKFRCKTGSLIPRDKTCDGIKNCIHGDDELPPVCKSGYVCSLGNGSCSIDLGNCKGWQVKANETEAVTNYAGQFNESLMVYKSDEGCHIKGLEQKAVKLKSDTFFVPENSSKLQDCNFYMSVYGTSPWIYVCEGDLVIKRGAEEVNNVCDRLFSAEIQNREWHYIYIPLEKLLNDFILNNVTSYFFVFQTVFFGEESLILDKFHLTEQCFPNDDNVPLPLEMSRDVTKTVVVLVACGAVFIIVLMVFVVLLYTKPLPKQFSCLKKLRKKTKSSVTFEPQRLSFDAPLLSNMNESHPYYPWYHECTLAPSITEDVKDLSRCTIKINRLLGRGAFGEVYEGIVIKDDVAVSAAIKKLPVGCSANDKKDFLLESFTISLSKGYMENMDWTHGMDPWTRFHVTLSKTKFKHKNIISCLGISVHQESPLLVLELMRGGDLKSFLRESRPTEGEVPMLSISELITLASDIAHGCEYLESCKFIHRDIAARNCLLTSKESERVAKIADFGLARDIISTNYYRKCGRSALPVRWMPPESFRHGIFSTKSDVWAFGVLLWEIFSYGCVPYGTGLPHQMIMVKVENGHHLEQPVHCSNAIYKVMTDCWAPDKESRPSFQTICKQLYAILQNGCAVGKYVRKSSGTSYKNKSLFAESGEDDFFEETV